MAKPESVGTGTLLIPISVFTAWAQTAFLPPGQFYTFGKVKEKGDNLELNYNFSTSTDPVPPADPATQPA